MLTREKRKYYSIALIISLTGLFLILSGSVSENHGTQALDSISTSLIEADPSSQEFANNIEVGRANSVGMKELGAIILGFGAVLIFSRFLQ
jgi:hypothetical protein